MLFEDTYRTIEASAEGFFKDKGSKFLAYLYPIESEAEVKQKIELLRKEHFKAVHCCYAYRLGLGGLAFRANDDGEPSGSAGRPILNVLLSKDLSNVLVVVVRYWGGTLLGIPGLINAYKTATENALISTKIIEKTVNYVYELRFDYIQLNDVMKVVKDLDLNILSQNFDNTCTLTLSFRRTLTNQILNRLEKTNGIQISFVGM